MLNAIDADITVQATKILDARLVGRMIRLCLTLKHEKKEGRTMKSIYTNQKDIRMGFWESTEGLNRSNELTIKYNRPDCDFRTDVRCAFVDYVDMLHREGRISDKLAHKVTLA